MAQRRTCRKRVERHLIYDTYRNESYEGTPVPAYEGRYRLSGLQDQIRKGGRIMVNGKVLPALGVVGIASMLAVGVGTMLLVLGPVASFSAPADAPADAASAVIGRWAAAYNAGDAEGLVKLYTPDAVLLGTRSPIISQGTEAIRAYFSALVKPTTGNKIVVDDRRTIVLGDLRSVLVTGFSTFLRGSAVTPDPARFTMLIVKRGSDWLIVHHHSSVRPQ